MGTGAFTQYIDVAQITLYVFWVFFILLIWYLRREDRREGYPLEVDGKGMSSHSVLFIPDPKTFHLPHGGTAVAPNLKADTRPVAASRRVEYPGTPLEPTGDPMADAVGPASYAERADEPDKTYDGKVKIIPMASDAHFHVAEGDPDPRGMDVLGADGEVAGAITEIWVDRSESCIRYYELKLPGTGRNLNRLLPVNCVRINDKNQVLVNSILASQFAGVPRTKNPDQVTLLEEDKIMGYYAGGRLYATPQRQEPLA
ncbi:MAG: photosynthetic reaction center subunit H [Pseudomonadota bacterium]